MYQFMIGTTVTAHKSVKQFYRYFSTSWAELEKSVNGYYKNVFKSIFFVRQLLDVVLNSDRYLCADASALPEQNPCCNC